MTLLNGSHNFIFYLNNSTKSIKAFCFEQQSVARFRSNVALTLIYC